MTLFDLSGKTAIVTGASRGIGEAIARRFAQHGANVVVSSRKADACDEVTNSINEEYPGKALTIPCNISEKEQLQNLVDKTREHFGQIDVLVCNAALNPYFGPAMDCPDEAFDKIMSANVKSNHWLANMVLPEMLERENGSIIIVSSIGGLKGSPVIGTYCISKGRRLPTRAQSCGGTWQQKRSCQCHCAGADQNLFCKGFVGQSGYSGTIHLDHAAQAYWLAG